MSYFYLPFFFFFFFSLNKFLMNDHCFNPFMTWPFSEVSFHSACTWLWVLPIRTVIDFVGFVWNFFQFLGSGQNGRIFHFFFEKKIIKVSQVRNLWKIWGKETEIRIEVGRVEHQKKEILGTIPVSTAAAERSFSKLKLIKNYLRTTMCHKRDFLG